MKRKTNISVQDNRGLRVTPNLIVGEKFNGYVSGDILDANSVADLVKGSEDVDIREVKYNELVSLRNNNKLVPGCKYRITDYVTTTAQANTQSAGHAFDIIVLATDTNVLNENALATKHKGDTYFANSNLAAWKLKYSLDNDTDKFEWADSTNGKGVIYYMKDEFNNECPYDFKNIKFNSHFTFNYYDTGVNKDMSMIDNTHNNIIKTYYSNNKQTLNNNVFIGNRYGTNNNILYYDCRNNTFGEYCYNNTLCNNCHDNTFDDSCQNNYLCDSCTLNNFGNSCSENYFHENCSSNTLESNCNHIFLGKHCSGNVLKDECYDITLCTACGRNVIGEGCQYNVLNIDCNNNTLGEYCYYNSLGCGCRSNVVEDYTENVIIENGNSHVTISTEQTVGLAVHLRNITITQGVNNTDVQKTIIHNTLNDSFNTTYQAAESTIVNL